MMLKTMIKRSWGIRHVRYFYHRIQVERWYASWAAMGMNDSNKYRDLLVLDRMWRGLA